MKVLSNLYLIVLTVLYALSLKTRSVFTNDMASRMSLVTAIGIRVKSTIPILLIVSLLSGNFLHRQKIREIVSEMKDFDEKVSEIRGIS